MTDFWMGYVAAVATYLVIGLLMGMWIVFTHLDHFHGGGFQYKRMAKQVGLTMMLWPMAIAELLA